MFFLIFCYLVVKSTAIVRTSCLFTFRLAAFFFSLPLNLLFVLGSTPQAVWHMSKFQPTLTQPFHAKSSDFFSFFQIHIWIVPATPGFFFSHIRTESLWYKVPSFLYMYERSHNTRKNKKHKTKQNTNSPLRHITSPVSYDVRSSAALMPPLGLSGTLKSNFHLLVPKVIKNNSESVAESQILSLKPGEVKEL